MVNVKKSRGVVTRNIIIWVVAAIAVFAGLYVVYGKYAGTGEDEGLIGGLRPAAQGEEELVKMPGFTLPDIEGNEVKLSDYRDKIVVLNFWTTWCKYCKTEMPEFQEAQKEYAESGDDVVMLTVNVQEDEETVKKYLSDNGITLPVLIDKDGSIAAAYGVNGFPTTYIIRKDGTLYKYAPGAIDKKTLKKMVDEIRK